MNKTVRRIQEDFKFYMDAFIEQEMLIDSNALEVQTSKDQTTITWAGSSGLSYLFSEYSSIKQYIDTLNNRDFTFCLADGALIQICYQVAKDEIIYHRLCYVPCPFDFKPEEWPGISLADIPSLLTDQDLINGARLASPIRFDFDAEFSDERHSHSHLSLNKKTCRIPAYGPVSLGHFLRFVLRYFYEDEFDAGSWWAEVQPKLYKRTLNFPSPHEIHIESAIGFE